MNTIRNILILLLLLSNASFATTSVFECNAKQSRFDGYEEYSKPIYFTTDSDTKDYSFVVAHIPIPAEFNTLKLNRLL